MNHQQIIEAGLQKRGTSLRTPFDSNLPVLFVRNRMFALLGTTRDGMPSVNLKTNPEEAWLQRETYPGSVIPGYHMNKRHWNTVILDGIVPDSVILDMLDASYLLVVAKLTKADREILSLQLG